MPSVVTTATSRTATAWSAELDTVRREKLFRSPPTGRSAYPALQEAVNLHIDAFNAVFRDNGHLAQGLKEIGVKSFLDGDSRKDALEDRNVLKLQIKEFFLDKPILPPSNKFATGKREVFPSECRERHATYKGKLRLRLGVTVNDQPWGDIVRDMGQLPVMLKSNKCHLERLSPAKLIHSGEESDELGGYFIVNGIEKIIRLLIAPRRNYPMAIERGSNVRGPMYSSYSVQIRSVRPDQTSQTMHLHYLNDGNVNMRFSWRKREYLIPVMLVLKALVETNDREIFENIAGSAGSRGLEKNQFVIDRVESLLRSFRAYKVYARAEARAYIGSRFRPVFNVPDSRTDTEAGDEFLRKIVLPHLGAYNVTESQDWDKFRMLTFMIRKLYAVVQGLCSTDNPDATSNHEILLGPILYGMSLKEKLEEWLSQIGAMAGQWSRDNDNRPFSSSDFRKSFETKILRKTTETIGNLMQYFLATGNLSSPSGLDQQQVSGYTIEADRLNFFRFISCFRQVHRGAFFANVKTTAVRKLRPESWGFLCPVHTPDGAPCGLLNHFAHKCKIATKSVDTTALEERLAEAGLTQCCSALLEDSVPVQLNGRMIGYCSPMHAKVLAQTLRHWKVEKTHGIPRELEIGYVPNSNGGQYPGVYLFSHPARMYRPVKYLPLNELDYVGPFEQPFMSIACREFEIEPEESTHVEYDPTHILSILANLTPYSDFNQSPRNMYQCQMAKQTMGTPSNALRKRADNKIFRLQTGQTPLVRTPLHHEYGCESFPNGTNAVVAVIAYTGYDMDDAMIINKSSHERGFGYGSIYKVKKLDLEDDQRRSRSMKTVTNLFGFAPGGVVKAAWRERVDDDGLPRIGTKVEQGDIIAVSHKVRYDPSTGELVNRDGQCQLHRYKDTETAYVEEVRILGSEEGNTPCNVATIKLRIPRGPVIGDKFSSRHGQKGVCSQKWPTTDMPFSESGMVPDVIINPHAFPSRMTIGMFVESLAGKAGCLHGFSQDSTPFKFEDKEGHTAVDYFGEQLREAGYNYYGNEPMYSGVTGEELQAQIYIGVVYYQRLRHMVNDKYQVRTTGPVNPATGQPVHGRAKGGGIRVGEMERDALIAHGTAYLIQDRLFNCSDYSKSWICRECGLFLGATPTVGSYGPKKRGTKAFRCRKCAKKATGNELMAEVWEDGDGTRYVGGEDTTVVGIPQVLRYLDVELASMGIRMSYDVSP